jgi:hypothetical protein
VLTPRPPKSLLMNFAQTLFSFHDIARNFCRKTQNSWDGDLVTWGKRC